MCLKLNSNYAIVFFVVVTAAAEGHLRQHRGGGVGHEVGLLHGWDVVDEPHHALMAVRVASDALQGLVTHDTLARGLERRTKLVQGLDAQAPVVGRLLVDRLQSRVARLPDLLLECVQIRQAPVLAGLRRGEEVTHVLVQRGRHGLEAVPAVLRAGLLRACTSASALSF